MICNFFPEPTYFIFSTDIPELLYYSHIPAALLALVVGVFVFLKGRDMLLNKLLLTISACFSLWCFANLILWTNIHSDFLLLVWTLYAVLFSFISVFSVYFVHVFVEGGDVSARLKYCFLALLTPAIILGPTSFHLGGWDITNCDAFFFEGFWYKFYYISLSVLAMVWILFLLIKKYREAATDFRKQIVLMGLGIELFLLSFFTLVFLASYLTTIGFLSDSRLEMYGLFGMVIFMSFIATLIVRFRTFNVGMLAAQALVIALVILISSMFTFADNTFNRVIIGITLAITGAIGLVLVRSVKKEVAQRQMIELQEKELEVANAQQERVVHFISHEVKGYLAKSAAAFASISSGDFGAVPAPLKSMSDAALTDVRKGVDTVMDILDASNLKRGTVSYAKKQFDLVDMVRTVVESLRPAAAEKGLALNFSAATNNVFTVEGDEEKLRQHVLRNIIDNSIKYTPKGSVDVTLTRSGQMARVTIADTGVGITKEDMAHLFTEGGHGKNSIKVNVHSTGYGLYIAKQIAQAHRGKVWAESDGEGKGSRFVIELPLVG